MSDKKTPFDREEFKLITKNERQFIKSPKDFLGKYADPNAMSRQYNNRIKYRSINAVNDLLFISEKLPEKRLQKIFTDDQIEQLFKVTLKAWILLVGNTLLL